MKELSKQELLCVYGGTSFTGTLMSALARGIDSIMDIGRSLGTAIRRMQGNRLCPIS